MMTRRWIENRKKVLTELQENNCCLLHMIAKIHSFNHFRVPPCFQESNKATGHRKTQGFKKLCDFRYKKL